MTVEEMRARLAAARDGLRHLAGLDSLDEEQARTFDWLEAEERWLSAEEQRAAERESRRSELRTRLESGHAGTESGTDPGPPQVNAGRSKEDPYDLTNLQTFGRSTSQVVGELRSRAESAVESHRDLTDDQRQAVVTKMQRVSDRGGFIPSYILRTGADAYGEAFHKYLAGRSDTWTDEERHAVIAAEEVRAALSTTDANGGYAIPFTLDPTLILTNDGTVNPVRQLARNVTVVTDNWNGLTSAGVTASWDGQQAEVSDDSPTFGQPSITPKKAQAFVQGTIEITQDYPGLVGDLQMLFADGKDRLESEAFISGTGANQPQGIVTALTGTSSEIATKTAEVLAVADIYGLAEVLPPRFRGARSKVAWIKELSTINAIRQFATSNNYHAFLTDLSAGQPRQLIGYPLHEASEMDAYSAVNTAANGTHRLSVIGDWNHYVVVDRIGATVEYIPHLFNTANNLPDGRRGWYMHWRTGADSVLDAAFRMLKLTTTA
jgi:HK97 family phage major capsid protein